MAASNPDFIAPLSLCNAVTVLSAGHCLWTVFLQEARARATDWRDLMTPAACAALVALVLLAGVTDATPVHDAEWLAALAGGAWLGRIRGRALPIEIDQEASVRLPRSSDGLVVAGCLLIVALVDFASAARLRPLIECHYVAAAAAFCAGFIGARTFVQVDRLKHHLSWREPPRALR
jgi:hypothetical protein